MSRTPELYGLKLERSSFGDYYRYHSQPAQNHGLEMGYSFNACPDHGEVSEFFCHHFCERFKAGRLSPMICNTLAAMWREGAFETVDRVLALNERN